MVRFMNGLWIALLAAIAAALVACGSVPSPDASRPDANNQDAAVTDRSAPQPDATMAPDTPLPPPPDVPATPDAPPPPPDAHVEDAPVPVMDAPPPPPDATVIVGFDPDICTTLNGSIWGVEGMSGSGTIICMMDADGRQAHIWIDALAGILGIGYTEGMCSNMGCGIPMPTQIDGCVLTNMNPAMRRFNATCNKRSFTIIYVRAR